MGSVGVPSPSPSPSQYPAFSPSPFQGTHFGASSVPHGQPPWLPFQGNCGAYGQFQSFIAATSLPPPAPFFPNALPLSSPMVHQSPTFLPQMCNVPFSAPLDNPGFPVGHVLVQPENFFSAEGCFTEGNTGSFGHLLQQMSCKPSSFCPGNSAQCRNSAGVPGPSGSQTDSDSEDEKVPVTQVDGYEQEVEDSGDGEESEDGEDTEEGDHSDDDEDTEEGEEGVAAFFFDPSDIPASVAETLPACPAAGTQPSGSDQDSEESDNVADVVDYEIVTDVHGTSGGSSPSGKRKRKRTKKGVKPPDFRKPSPMGTIEIALRRAPTRKTQFIFQPVMGMVFDSREEDYQFYNLYSWEVGFGIRYGNSSKNRGNGKKTMQEIVCEKEGYYDRCTSSSKRDGCNARIRLHRSQDDGWYVSLHEAEHNHPLSEFSDEKREWKSHSKIEQCTKDIIRYLRENNVTLSRVHCILGSMYGSMDDIPFSQKTLRGVCAQIAKDLREDDWQKTLDIFREMRAEDPGFQFSVDFDKQHKLKTLLWTSGRSRSQYQFFGDVVTFDTTYCTNLYKMPFGIFVGVNNHFQSTLFAGVLMRRETTKSFKWVFKEFLNLMGGKAPVTILTDQSKAMTRAIKEVMPKTKHLWCKWHVLRSAPEDLGPVYRRNGPFRDEFHYFINEMLTKDEFERAWVDLLDRYELHDHPFMQKAYDKREKWAKPWASDTFCARMASTQRSESANSMLKKLIPRNTSMNHFVTQYRKLLWRRTNAERTAEHETKQWVLKSKRMYAIEKHAMSIYTKNVFELFREEVDMSTDYNVLPDEMPGNYLVVHSNSEKRKNWARVVFSVSVINEGERYICQCGLFEHFGMLCRHILKVCIHHGVNKVPEYHIVKRWTRKAREIGDGIVAVQFGQGDSSVMNQLQKSILYAHALEVVRSGYKDSEAAAIVMRHLSNARKELERLSDCRIKEKGHLSLEGSASDDSAPENDSVVPNTYGTSGRSAGLSDSELESVLPPEAQKPQGRPRANRFRSFHDSMRKGRKKAASRNADEGSAPPTPANAEVMISARKKTRRTSRKAVGSQR